eukprot:CAMPEP_0170580292 /NCGR_PEP_ID=MMETSP0224-20130122/6432_1 /TAXON_ID=285029 /ORGANISM="Togula jolla, Strain CCCM 725" /LENGTH=106 /DNA_ID=CAMNT_0010903359 /DNA_START=46 /DNA_END=366 /DNA_ORIENTATION=-
MMAMTGHARSREKSDRWQLSNAKGVGPMTAYDPARHSAVLENRHSRAFTSTFGDVRRHTVQAAFALCQVLPDFVHGPIAQWQRQLIVLLWERRLLASQVDMPQCRV